MKERWWFAPDARAVLGARLDLSVAGWMQAAAAGEVLSTDRDSAAVRLGEADRTVESGILVKWRAVRPKQRGRWWLRASRERCEARGLHAARACGIDGPLPLAVGERRDGWGRLLGSVLVRSFVLGLGADDPRVLFDDDSLGGVARGLRGWHDAGFRHGDCWPKNVLFVDATRILPIGAPKAFRTARGANLDRARCADLARFAAGARECRTDPFDFLEAYVSSAPALARGTVESAVRPLYERVLAKRAEDVRTRPTREPHGPPQPQPLPPDSRVVPRSVVTLAE